MFNTRNILTCSAVKTSKAFDFKDFDQEPRKINFDGGEYTVLLNQKLPRVLRMGVTMAT